jgi:hypothetical protein
MNRLVALVAAIGICAFAAVVIMGKYHTIYRDHYEFRRVVVPGTASEQVVQGFGEPYRTYWTPTAVHQVLSGRGLYSRFDQDVSRAQTVPPDYAKVLHYRTTIEHGEFVFVGYDGRVLRVITGRSTRADR